MIDAMTDTAGPPIYIKPEVAARHRMAMDDQEIHNRMAALAEISDRGHPIVSAGCRNDGDNNIIFSIMSIIDGEFRCNEMEIPQDIPIRTVEHLLILSISLVVRETGAHTDWELNRMLCGFSPEDGGP
jgi:hypothetical protein